MASRIRARGTLPVTPSGMVGTPALLGVHGSWAEYFHGQPLPPPNWLVAKLISPLAPSRKPSFRMPKKKKGKVSVVVESAKSSSVPSGMRVPWAKEGSGGLKGTSSTR